MGMTITEKILAAHADKLAVEPGEFIDARVDLAMTHDGTGWTALQAFKEVGVDNVFDREKVVICPDHAIPNKNINAANVIKDLRDFARKQGLAHFFEVGRSGICHSMMPQEGLILPGELAVASDSHTVTYGGLGAFSTGIGSTDLGVVWALGTIWLKVPSSIKFVYRGKPGPWVQGKDLILYTISQIGVDGARYEAMEFTGDAFKHLPISSRFTMCNMAVEAGAKNGIVAPDEITEQWVKPRAKRPYKMLQSDPDAKYREVYEWDVSKLKPQVALPHIPSNVRAVDEIGEIPIDQAFLGSCTNGWLEDLREAATVIKGKKVNPNVRFIVIPATQEIFYQAMKEGLLETFVEAGAAVGTPTCGPCSGGQMGVLAEGERAVSTSNRNFVGRMGHVNSEVVLANPAVVAASAIKGRVASPEEVK